MRLRQLLRNFPDDFSGFLYRDSKIPIALLNEEFHICDANSAFLCVLGLEELPEGKPFTDFLETESSLEDLAGGSGTGRISLKHRRNLTQTMDCSVFKIADHTVLVGHRIMVTESGTVEQIAAMHQDLINLNRELTRKNHQLEEARKRIKVLGGLLPICMYCKKIRNDKGYWDQLEMYIDDHSEARFSHSICPECAKKHFPETAGDTDDP